MVVNRKLRSGKHKKTFKRNGMYRKTQKVMQGGDKPRKYKPTRPARPPPAPPAPPARPAPLPPVDGEPYRTTRLQHAIINIAKQKPPKSRFFSKLFGRTKKASPSDGSLSSALQSSSSRGTSRASRASRNSGTSETSETSRASRNSGTSETSENSGTSNNSFIFPGSSIKNNNFTRTFATGPAQQPHSNRAISYNQQINKKEKFEENLEALKRRIKNKPLINKLEKLKKNASFETQSEIQRLINTHESYNYEFLESQIRAIKSRMSNNNERRKRYNNARKYLKSKFSPLSSSSSTESALHEPSAQSTSPVRSALMRNISMGAALLRPVNRSKLNGSKPTGNPRSSLLEAIKAGTTLKPVKALTSGSQPALSNSIASSLKARRLAINGNNKTNNW